MTEDGKRPAIWDFEKYPEIYVPNTMCEQISNEDLGKVVAAELKKHGAVVVIRGVPNGKI